MGNPERNEKTLESGQLTVKTDRLASDNASVARTSMSGSITPLNEKAVKETSAELSRNSTVSTPSTVHPLNPFDTDVEAMMPQCSETLNKKSTLCTTKTNQECPVWPGQEHWKQKARAAKINNRSCQCMARLDKRTRLIVKIIIGLVVIGIAVGVGLGISKSLGAPIWKPKDS